MSRKVYTPEQIIRNLRAAEVNIAENMTAQQATRQIGVTEHSYYRQRKECGGMKVDQARRLRELEKENTRLRKIVADLSLDNSILKEVASGSF